MNNLKAPIPIAFSRLFKLVFRDNCPVHRRVRQDELSVVLTSLGCSTKPEDLEVMLKEADLDSDGKINYEDWTLSPFESSSLE
jgi:hypothetical protein